MVESKSKGAVRLNAQAMKEWEKRISEVQKAQQERQKRPSSNGSSAAAAG